MSENLRPKSSAFRAKLDPRIWSTKDGHHYTSIKTQPPARWTTASNALGLLCYVSGDYVITRRRYGKSSWTYGVKRLNVEISLSDFARLKDAKEYAQRNARGLDTVNVA